MAKRQIIVQCETHGPQHLSDAEYRQQLNKANEIWCCPQRYCFAYTVWVGIWHPCADPKCGGYASEDTSICDECGQDQYVLYLADELRKSTILGTQ